jgi:hypothetical protein
MFAWVVELEEGEQSKDIPTEQLSDLVACTGFLCYAGVDSVDY